MAHAHPPPHGPKNRRAATSAGIVSFGILNTRNPLVGYMKHAPQTHGNHATRVLHGQVMTLADVMRSKALRHNVHTGTFHVAPGAYTALHTKYRPPAGPVSGLHRSASDAPTTDERIDLPSVYSAPVVTSIAATALAAPSGNDGFWYDAPVAACAPATALRAVATIGRGLSGLSQARSDGAGVDPEQQQQLTLSLTGVGDDDGRGLGSSSSSRGGGGLQSQRSSQPPASVGLALSPGAGSASVLRWSSGSAGACTPLPPPLPPSLSSQPQPTAAPVPARLHNEPIFPSFVAGGPPQGLSLPAAAPHAMRHRSATASDVSLEPCLLRSGNGDDGKSVSEDDTGEGGAAFRSTCERWGPAAPPSVATSGAVLPVVGPGATAVLEPRSSKMQGLIPHTGRRVSAPDVLLSSRGEQNQEEKKQEEPELRVPAHPARVEPPPAPAPAPASGLATFTLERCASTMLEAQAVAPLPAVLSPRGYDDSRALAAGLASWAAGVAAAAASTAAAAAVTAMPASISLSRTQRSASLESAAPSHLQHQRPRAGQLPQPQPQQHVPQTPPPSLLAPWPLPRLPALDDAIFPSVAHVGRGAVALCSSSPGGGVGGRSPQAAVLATHPSLVTAPDSPRSLQWRRQARANIAGGGSGIPASPSVRPAATPLLAPPPLPLSPPLRAASGSVAASPGSVSLSAGDAEALPPPLALRVISHDGIAAVGVSAAAGAGRWTATRQTSGEAPRMSSSQPLSSSTTSSVTPPFPPPSAPPPLPPVVTIGRTGIVVGMRRGGGSSGSGGAGSSAIARDSSCSGASPLSAIADELLLAASAGGSVRLGGGRSGLATAATAATAAAGDGYSSSECGGGARAPMAGAPAPRARRATTGGGGPQSPTRPPNSLSPVEDAPTSTGPRSPASAQWLGSPPGSTAGGGGGSSSTSGFRAVSFRSGPPHAAAPAVSTLHMHMPEPGRGASLLSASSAATKSGPVSAPDDPPGAAPALRHVEATSAGAAAAAAGGRTSPAEDAGEEEEVGGTQDLAFALESYTRAAAAAAAESPGGAITPTAQEVGGGGRTRRRLPSSDDPDAPYIFTPPGAIAAAADDAEEEEGKDGTGEQAAVPPPPSARPMSLPGAPPPLRVPQPRQQPTDDPFSSSSAAAPHGRLPHRMPPAVAAALFRHRLPHSPSEALRSVNRLIAWPAGTVAPLSPRSDGGVEAGSMHDADADSGASFLMSPLGTPEVQPLPPPMPQAAAAPSSWGGWGAGSSDSNSSGGNPYSMLPATRASSAAPLFGPGAGVKHGPIAADYELGRQIGDGGFAVVRLAVVKEGGDGAAAARGHPLVVKCVRKQYLVSPEERDSAVREVEIHRSLSGGSGGGHPRVVPLFDAYEDADHVYLVMEAAAGGDLASYVRAKCVRQFSEIQTRVIVDQLLEALEVLHGRGILHADVKPHNVLIAGRSLLPAVEEVAAEATGRGSRVPPVPRPPAGRTTSGGALTSFIEAVKLCDFGTARRSRDARYYRLTGDVGLVPWTSVTGTAGYIAPEILQRRHYSSPVDLWSVGILLYECLAGFSPFYPYAQCLTGPPDFPARPWASISGEAQDLCRGLLQADPAKRLTAAEARAHEWFAR